MLFIKGNREQGNGVSIVLANRAQARTTLEKLPLFTEKAYINGKWTEATSRKSFDIFGSLNFEKCWTTVTD